MRSKSLLANPSSRNFVNKNTSFDMKVISLRDKNKISKLISLLISLEMKDNLLLARFIYCKFVSVNTSLGIKFKLLALTYNCRKLFKLSISLGIHFDCLGKYKIQHLYKLYKLSQ